MSQNDIDLKCKDSLQEYFPNGGRDWDKVEELYQAIKDGKFEHIKVVTN